MDIPKGFGKRVREARLAAGLRERELADFMGVAIKTVSAYENGKQCPSPEKLFWMAKGLNVTMDYLWSGGTQTVEMYHWLPWMPDTCKTPREDGKSLFVRCSHCGGTFARVLCGESNFCPDCGSPMTDEGVRIRLGGEVHGR